MIRESDRALDLDVDKKLASDGCLLFGTLRHADEHFNLSSRRDGSEVIGAGPRRLFCPALDMNTCVASVDLAAKV